MFDQLPRERATVEAGVYAHHSIRLTGSLVRQLEAEYFTPLFLPYVERTLRPWP